MTSFMLSSVLKPIKPEPEPLTIEAERNEDEAHEYERNF